MVLSQQRLDRPALIVQYVDAAESLGVEVGLGSLNSAEDVITRDDEPRLRTRARKLIDSLQLLASELGPRPEYQDLVSMVALHASELVDDALQENRFLDAIIENIPDMIFVKDADKLAFERFNRAGEELLGTTRSNLLGKNDYDFFPADQAKFFQEKDHNTLRSRQLLDIPEEPIQTKSGLRWLHTKKVPILDDHGHPRYLLGISEDITARKAAAAALLLAKEEAEAANRELESFSYSVAHDLRAPLRGIDGFSQALLEDYGDKLDADGHDYLRRVRESAQHMARLIDNLLSLSRMTLADLKRSRVDLSTFARDAGARLQQLFPAREIELVITPQLMAYCDPRLMVAVFDNLLGNAWKFTGKRERARVEVGSLQQDGETVFFVRDDGAGFDMAYASKLFGAFQRLHTVSEFEGTGVGLATVERIVRRHGGRIWAQGEVGNGAVFYFTLEHRSGNQGDAK